MHRNAYGAEREALNRGELAVRRNCWRVTRCCCRRANSSTSITGSRRPIRPRRFDTRFFLACAPHGQDGSHDNSEAVHSVWLRPAEALERAERKEIEIAFATGFVLKELAALRDRR